MIFSAPPEVGEKGVSSITVQATSISQNAARKIVLECPRWNIDMNSRYPDTVPIKAEASSDRFTTTSFAARTDNSAPPSHKAGRHLNAIKAVPATTKPAACIRLREKLNLNSSSGFSASLIFCQSSVGASGNDSVSSHNINMEKGTSSTKRNERVPLSTPLARKRPAAMPDAIPTIFQSTSASAAERDGSQTCASWRASEYKNASKSVAATRVLSCCLPEENKMAAIPREKRAQYSRADPRSK